MATEKKATTTKRRKTELALGGGRLGLGNASLRFVLSDQGRKVGELTIRRSSITYKAANKRTGRSHWLPKLLNTLEEGGRPPRKRKRS